MLQKLKNKWGVENNFQIVIIFIVFAVTGSVAAKISGPITAYFELDQAHRFPCPEEDFLKTKKGEL